jgi:hypothetical protein
MRWLVLLVVMGCAEHGKGGGDAWDVRAIQLVETVCRSSCVAPDRQDDCIIDFLARIDRARETLPDSDETACMECMRLETQLFPQVEANGCESTPALDEMLNEQCALAGFDANNDGDLTNDFGGEVCTGIP